MFGYTGKIARIDLSTGQITDYSLSQAEREKFIGGKILAAKIIYDSMTGAVEAFSEENIIVITTSPLTGSASPSSSRFNISTVSPLTGLLVSSNCGGNFGLHLKRAGFDGLIIFGRSKEKVYIDIHQGEIIIKSARDIWGKNTGETANLLGGTKRGTLVIGIAGENLVRYAAVISQERAAGRGGIGAVLGHKNLKGVVASGAERTEICCQDKFKRHNRRWIKQLRAHKLTGQQLPELGTAALLSMMQQRNLLATKNYSSGSFSDFDKISGESLKEEHLLKNRGCVSCPIQCGRVVEIEGKPVKGPELETMALLGSNLLNSDLSSILRLNHLCDEYGLDTMSFGGSVGLAMELNERGLWDNGLNFGDATQLEEVVKMVATRQGIGADLAEGTKRISQKYGGQDFAIHAKGMELAAYEPRAAQGMGLGYATANRGGCHLNGGYMVALEGLGLAVNGATTRGKAAFTIFFQDMMEAVSASGTCLFTTYALLPDKLVGKEKGLARLINGFVPFLGGAVGLLHNNPQLMGFNLKSILPHPYSVYLVTGFKMNMGRFIRAGERGYNLERIINLRQGLRPEDDSLPKRLTKELQRSDNLASKVRLAEMLQQYYRIRGWDEQGRPTQLRLKKLGLAQTQ